MSHKKLQQNISRLMALLLCLMLVIPAVPLAYAVGGSCGTGLTWSFDGSTLTITGSGALIDYTDTNLPPWYEYREQIIRLSLPEGLTRIGSLSFCDCINLQSVSLPSTVEYIGEAAFYNNRSMTMLSLNKGLYTIDRKAFAQCKALADIRLPGTLLRIENYAFSSCSELRYITIPSSVMEFGSGVFSYCDNLIRVDVLADVELPSWSFSGCNHLQTVTVQGASVKPESLKTPNYPNGSSIGEGQGTTEVEPEPETTPPATESAPAPSTGTAFGESITTDTSGGQIVDKTTVVTNDNSTTISSTKTPAGQQGGGTTTITSTIHDDPGWQDVLDKINSATIGGNTTPVDVIVYLPNSDTVSANVLEELAGKNVNLTVQTQSGGIITLDGQKLDSVKEDLVLGYTLIAAENVPEELAGCTVYQLNFYAGTKVPTEMIIRLPGGHALSTATLYQVRGNKLEQLQYVMVDENGDSHWYLGSVDEKTDYLIGIDVPNMVEEFPIIPQELYDTYKVENVYDGLEYVVTGRKSSWGVNLGQVMSILAVVMVTVIVVVGVIMYSWNKQRLKKGYVPKWDDEDES